MRERMVSMGALLTVYAAFCAYAIIDAGAFSDDRWYLLYVEVFRGNAAISDVAIPFCWRPIVPLLVALIPTTATTGAFILVSIAFGAGFLIVLYHICLEFTERDIVILPIMLLLVTGANLYRYAVLANIETAQLFFIALIALWVLQDRPITYIIAALFVGVFVKETVIFAGLLYIVYRWHRWPVISGVILTSTVYIAFRYVLSGTISQGIVFRLDNFTVRAFMTFQNLVVGLLIVGILWLVGVLLDPRLSRKALNWSLVTTLTIGLPIAILGFFFAFSGARFLMPLWIGVVPMIMSMFDNIGVNEE